MYILFKLLFFMHVLFPISKTTFSLSIISFLFSVFCQNHSPSLYQIFRFWHFHARQVDNFSEINHSISFLDYTNCVKRRYMLNICQAVFKRGMGGGGGCVGQESEFQAPACIRGKQPCVPCWMTIHMLFA